MFLIYLYPFLSGQVRQIYLLRAPQTIGCRAVNNVMLETRLLFNYIASYLLTIRSLFCASMMLAPLK